MLNASVFKRTLLVATLLALAAFLIFSGIAVAVRQATSLAGLVGGVSLALGLAVVIRRTDALVLLRALQGLRLFLPIAAFEVVSQFVGESSGSLHFDEIAAQVIPVFLLALAIEARFFRLNLIAEPLDLGAMLFTLLLLGSGEFYAMQAIANEQPEHADLIGGAVAAGFVAVSIVALVGPGLNEEKES